MSATFEAVYRDRIAANILRLERVTHRRALVNHLNTRFFERRHYLRRITAGGFNHGDATFDNRFHIAGIVGRVDRGQEREIYTDRLVR